MVNPVDETTHSYYLNLILENQMFLAQFIIDNSHFYLTLSVLDSSMLTRDRAPTNFIVRLSPVLDETHEGLAANFIIM